MPVKDPLGFDLGFRIVSKALDNVCDYEHITLETPLRVVLRNAAARQNFQEEINKIVRAYKIDQSKLKITLKSQSLRTIGDVTNMIASLGLPGDKGGPDRL